MFNNEQQGSNHHLLCAIRDVIKCLTLNHLGGKKDLFGAEGSYIEKSIYTDWPYLKM